MCADPARGCFRVRVGDRVEIVVPEGFDPRELLALLMMLKEAGEGSPWGRWPGGPWRKPLIGDDAIKETGHVL